MIFNNINLNLDVNADNKISIALMASFVILTIQYFILIYFNLLETTAAYTVQVTSKMLVGLAFLYALPAVLKRSKIKIICIYFIAVFVFSLHYMIFPENQLYIKELLFPFFFMCLPAFIYTLSIRDWIEFRKIIEKASFIVFVFGVILGGLIFAGRASVGAYSMSLSYYMLLPTIIFLDQFLEKFSLRILIFTIISLLVILALGSRGAILCIIIFVFLKLIKPSAKLSYQRVIAYFGIFGVGIGGYIFLDRILEAIYNFLLYFGIRSRSILLFLSEDVHLSGRDKIYENVIKEIIENPILGIGLAGDRCIIGGSYAHNFFIELLGDFGVIIGGIIIFTLFIFIVKSLITKNKDKYNMIIIWLSLGFVHLIVSSSYLIDMKFWILSGLMVNGLYQRNKNININVNS